ncbi:hypothetical protein Tco_0186020, partial [Tanacetum coccineum]
MDSSIPLDEHLATFRVHQPPGNDIQAFVDLFNAVLAARSPTGSSISGEASVAPGLVKVLVLVIKENVHAAEANAGRSHNATKPTNRI